MDKDSLAQENSHWSNPAAKTHPAAPIQYQHVVVRLSAAMVWWSHHHPGKTTNAQRAPGLFCYWNWSFFHPLVKGGPCHFCKVQMARFFLVIVPLSYNLDHCEVDPKAQNPKIHEPNNGKAAGRKNPWHYLTKKTIFSLDPKTKHSPIKRYGLRRLVSLSLYKSKCPKSCCF